MVLSLHDYVVCMMLDESPWNSIKIKMLLVLQSYLKNLFRLQLQMRYYLWNLSWSFCEMAVTNLGVEFVFSFIVSLNFELWGDLRFIVLC